MPQPYIFVSHMGNHNCSEPQNEKDMGLNLCSVTSQMRPWPVSSTSTRLYPHLKNGNIETCLIELLRRFYKTVCLHEMYHYHFLLVLHFASFLTQEASLEFGKCYLKYMFEVVYSSVSLFNKGGH